MRKDEQESHRKTWERVANYIEGGAHICPKLSSKSSKIGGRGREISISNSKESFFYQYDSLIYVKNFIMIKSTGLLNCFVIGKFLLKSLLLYIRFQFSRTWKGGQSWYSGFKLVSEQKYLLSWVPLPADLWTTPTGQEIVSLWHLCSRDDLE